MESLPTWKFSAYELHELFSIIFCVFFFVAKFFVRGLRLSNQMIRSRDGNDLSQRIRTTFFILIFFLVIHVIYQIEFKFFAKSRFEMQQKSLEISDSWILICWTLTNESALEISWWSQQKDRRLLSKYFWCRKKRNDAERQ